MKQASLVPVSQTEEILTLRFYQELERAEFFIAIQERFIQKSRLMMQKDQKMDIGEFLSEMMMEYQKKLSDTWTYTKSSSSSSLATWRHSISIAWIGFLDETKYLLFLKTTPTMSPKPTIDITNIPLRI